MTTKKLKICHVTSMHDWYDDRIFERACVGLSSLGYEVTYIAQAEKDKIVDGVQIIAIPIRKRLGKHLLGPWEAFFKMLKIDADIYHFYNPNMMIFMAIWALSGKKVFIDVHENYESRVAIFPWQGFNKLVQKAYRFFENFMCSFYCGVTVVTNSMKQKLSSSNVPILIVDNVPYLDRLKDVKLAKRKYSSPTIITSGTHSPARNCDKAIQAMPLILAEIPDAHMKFVGRFFPGYEDTLLKLAAELGVSKNVSFEGMVPWLENFERVSQAHIGCVFYEDNPNNRLTLPNRLYEYMFCGLAVLGEDFPEVRNVIENSNAGYCVNSENIKDIAEKAIILLKDNSILIEKGRYARQSVIEQYNFENALIEIEKFYLQYGC
jgi:glycosyltransferase involved in cell wall biosynthesis